jgi:hypothetical protein
MLQLRVRWQGAWHERLERFRTSGPPFSQSMHPRIRGASQSFDTVAHAW